MSNKNNIELEYKFWVKDKEKLIKVLNQKASASNPRQYQSNVMFDNPAGTMQKTDGRIRVRTLGDSGEKTLTYKKPLSPKMEQKEKSNMR